jgi:alpha-tubulin suppressor-like RCC1 family protein
MLRRAYDFVQVGAGSNHSLAVRSNGSLVGWGRNQYGQATVPVGNNFVQVAAGEFHSLALRSDGSLVGWGRNNYGQYLYRPDHRHRRSVASERHPRWRRL